MTPETIDIAAEAWNAAKWLGGFLVGLIVWLGKRELTQVTTGLSNKADKEHVQRENEGLKMEIKELREARERDAESRQRDYERMERTNAERFDTLATFVRDKFGSLERNVDQKFDMILQSINQIRKE